MQLPTPSNPKINDEKSGTPLSFDLCNRMNQSSTTPKSYFPKTRIKPSLKSRVRQFLSFLLIGVAPGLVWMFIPSRAPGDSATQAASARWREQASTLGAKLLQTHNAEAEKAKERIHAIVTAAKQDAPAMAGQAAAPFLGFKPTANHVWMLAWDKVRGTDNFPRHVASVCKPAIEWQAGTVGKIGFELERLEQCLGAADNGFRRELVDFSGNAEEVLKALELDVEGFGKMLEAQKHLTLEVAGASAAVALEVVFIRTTIETIRVVAAAAIRRMTRAAAAAGTSLVIDGPLPFGDIVGAFIVVGGTVWTIHDVHSAAKAMGQLRPTIEKQLQASLEKIEHDAIERINASTAAHAAVARVH